MQKNYYRGGVSMFIVAVTCVLVTIVVAGFIRLMNRDSEQASRYDLSQSAYDSAQAGVEDAKRALLKWRSTCENKDAASQASCARMSAELNKELKDQSCKLLPETFGIGDPSKNETVIRNVSSNRAEALNQAYTCLKIAINSNDFLGEVSNDKASIIRLDPLSPITKVRISWFSEKDSSSNNLNLQAAPVNLLESFPKHGDWPQNRPTVLNAQFVLDGGVNYDGSGARNSDFANSRSMLFYPTNNSVVNSTFNATLTGLPAVRNNFASNSITGVRCNNAINGGYACSVVVELGRTINSASNAFMKISSRYNNTTNYSVEMLNAQNSVVKFNGVQPVVDSTGRANDLFRRVQSRLEMGSSNFGTPVNEFATEGNFCKRMIIRDSTKPSTINCR